VPKARGGIEIAEKNLRDHARVVDSFARKRRLQLTGQEHHQLGIQFFEEGRFCAAIGEFQQSIKLGANSEIWNDWATAQLADGDLAKAEEGYCRALHADKQYAPAAINLSLLLLQLGRASEALPFLSVLERAAASAEESQRPALTAAVAAIRRTVQPIDFVRAFLTAVQRLPRVDPNWPEYLKAAQAERAFDSSYLVKEGLRLLRELPEEVQPYAIQALTENAAALYVYGLIAAVHYLEQGNLQAALPLLRAATSANVCDLYAENLMIDTEVAAAEAQGRRHEAFSGLREYLAESFCDRPWTCLDINAFNFKEGGKVTVCDAWSPVFIGNTNCDPLYKIWNSPMAQEFRRSILDGSFRYCGKVRCPMIAQRKLAKRPSGAEGGNALYEGPLALKKPKSATADPESWRLICKTGPVSSLIGVDRTCNLACRQCRPHFYQADENEQRELNQMLDGFSAELWKSVRVVRMNTAGEVFFSKPCRRLLKELTRERYPELRFDLISNGQLFNRETFEEFDLRGRMSGLSISVDAATEATYRICRRGGDFSRLLSNLAFLDGLRQNEGETFIFRLEFVVSAWNFREMADFVRLGKKYHVDIVNFAAFFNWHYSNEEFAEINVADPGHPCHGEFLEMLRAPEIDDPIVAVSGLLHLRERGRHLST
jgi:tetratricopeptide (TPR) repeat protein/wyosine [tRNA(Phe)-imidazoG37] synthetase (radical SAM superfamily)